MFFRQYSLDCLSLYSYMIGDTGTGRAVVVDPQRDISQYLADAAAQGLRIERVIETHFHADFLSGHLELAKATGAVISYGSRAQPDFPIDALAHGAVLPLGDVTLEIRHTPGHTPESISVVVRERADVDPWAVLTGDTLFIGDVGRPDLLASVGYTADELGRMLFRSLHEQLMTLPDATLVFPAHGAGSACGKNLSTAASSSIGEQRRFNYALQAENEGDFLRAVTQGQSVAPAYFAFAADANKHSHALLDDQQAPPRVALPDAIAHAAAGAVMIDTRAPEVFASGHVRNSINVGLDGRFAEYAGDVVRPGQRVIVLTDAGRSLEAKVRLARIGFDAVVGAVEDVDVALAAHPEFAAPAKRLPANEAADWLARTPGIQVLDVRNPGETADGMIPGARNVPLPSLLDDIATLDPARPTLVYCAGGYRSSIAASALRAHGFVDIADILGGYGAWLSTTNPPKEHIHV